MRLSLVAVALLLAGSLAGCLQAGEKLEKTSDDAATAADRAAAVSNRHHFVLAYRALACADSGRLAEARALHDELRTKRAHGYVPYFSLATSASAIGDMDGAIEYAQQACDEREPGLVITTRVFPRQHRLRDDPRFADVLRRIGFPNLP